MNANLRSAGTTAVDREGNSMITQKIDEEGQHDENASLFTAAVGTKKDEEAPSWKTLVDVLYFHASIRANHKIFTWVDLDCKEVCTLTFKDLSHAATAVAVLWHKKGCRAGDRVIIAYPFGLEFLAGIFGCMEAGVVACSVYPPNPRNLAVDMPRFHRFVRDAGAKYALTTKKFATLMRFAGFSYPKKVVTWLPTDNIPTGRSDNKHSHHHATAAEPRRRTRIALLDPEDVAFIQYTSGSTGHTKGVMISHRSLLNNVKAISKAFGATTKSTGAVWVPQYHDMGLIGCYFSSLYSASHTVATSPTNFLSRPLLWTEMVEKYRADITCGPNFSFALLIRRLEESPGDSKTANWSHVKCISLGAEPTRAQVVRGIIAKLKAPPDAIQNSYGLAECGLFVTTGPTVFFENRLVSCGPVNLPGTRVVIVKNRKRLTLDGEVGSIWIQSQLAANGYWNDSDATRATFQNSLADGEDEGIWLDTGDLGMVIDGNLFVTGREKDVIIINGRNYYPTDLEDTVDACFHSKVRPGRSVAFQNSDEGVAIVVEARMDYEKDAHALATHIKAETQRAYGIKIEQVWVLRRGTVPKTTSGKLRRHLIRDTSLNERWTKKQVLAQWKVSQFQLAEQPSVRDDKGNFLVIPICPNSRPGRSTQERYYACHRSSTLPIRFREVAKQLNSDQVLLQKYFDSLSLPGVLRSEWEAFDKSTCALQGFCMGSINAIETHQPSMVQFAHCLTVNPKWITVANISDFVEEVVHIGFVLDWAMRKLADSSDLLREKLKHDEVGVACLTAHIPPRQVATEARRSIKDTEEDPLIGVLTFFEWMNYRGIQQTASGFVTKIRERKAQLLSKEIITLNIAEALWEQARSGSLSDNVLAGQWLISSLAQCNAESEPCDNQPITYPQHWCRVYGAWNLAFLMGLDEKISRLFIPICFIPFISYSTGDQYVYRCFISLYLAFQLSVERSLQSDSGSDSKMLSRSLISKEATDTFGSLNWQWVQKLASVDSINWKCTDHVPPEIPTGKWFKCFDKWSGEKVMRNWDSDNILTNLEETYHRVLTAVLGPRYRANQTWEENGLTSVMLVEFVNRISDNFSVTLPPNFSELYKTPLELKSFLMERSATSFPIKPFNDYSNSAGFIDNWIIKRIPFSREIIQFFGIMAILFLFASSLLPVYYLGVHFAGDTSGRQGFKVMLLPFAVPIWMASFSAEVILCKWIVIGRYKEEEIDALSFSFLKWWFMDRLMHVWEVLIGPIVKDTPILWLMYCLMGAKVHFFSQLDAFIREFDLAEIGKFSSVEHQVRCRKFTPWTVEERPKIRFRSIAVGKNCIVRGMLCPGACLGEGPHVERLAVVPEGGQVPPRSLVIGNPATSHGETVDASEINARKHLLLGALKIMWLFIIMYAFFGVGLAGNFLLQNAITAHSWRYAQLLYGSLLFIITFLLSIPLNILLKWVLIGRRKAGQGNGSVWQIAANWMVDTHFSITFNILFALTCTSRFWNAVLRLYGMDVDFVSKVNIMCFPPSTMDLVRVRKSFVSTVICETSKHGSLHPIRIERSSVGVGCVIGPGILVQGSLLPPLVHVKNDIIGHHEGGRIEHSLSSFWREEVLECTIMHLIFLGLVFCSLVPSYELCIIFIKTAPTAEVTVLLVGIVWLIQTLVWTFLLYLIQCFALLRARRTEPWNTSLYRVYLSASYAFNHTFSCLPIFYGTRFFNVVLRFLGASFEGNAIYFGNPVFDFPYITFADKTIVDGANPVAGHHAVYSNIVLGRAYVSGLIHDGTAILANMVATGKESGPLRACCVSQGSA